ncbi:MAG: hypothetical protein N2Z79_01225 [Candidatus Omnitrophica bacterium]|nr:hypothetical protein [Candidatus Omnitrophota bacterium]
MKRNRIGLTFTELLIVSSLFLIIGIVVYAVTRNTINFWYRIKLSSELEDLNIIFDKLSFDLQNSFRFKGISILGNKERLEFPCLVNSSKLKKITVGKIIYEFDSLTKTLNKYQLDYSDIYNDKFPNPNFSLRNVESLEFQYYIYDKNKKAYFWQEELKDDDIFKAVRLKIKFLNREFSYTVDIPYA